MEPLAAIYLSVSLGVYLLAIAAAVSQYERYAGLAFCGMLLFLYCLFGNVMWTGVSEPDSYRLDPVLDLAALLMIGLMHWRRPAVWKAALTLCFLTQLCLHAWFWGSRVGVGPELPMRSYEWLINGLFVFELLSVAIPGGGHVAGRVLAWLSRRWAVRGVAAAQQGREG